MTATNRRMLVTCYANTPGDASDLDGARMTVAISSLTHMAAKKGRVLVFPSLRILSRKTPLGETVVVRAMTACRPEWKRVRRGN